MTTMGTIEIGPATLGWRTPVVRTSTYPVLEGGPRGVAWVRVTVTDNVASMGPTDFEVEALSGTGDVVERPDFTERMVEAFGEAFYEGRWSQ